MGVALQRKSLERRWPEKEKLVPGDKRRCLTKSQQRWNLQTGEKTE